MAVEREERFAGMSRRFIGARKKAAPQIEKAIQRLNAAVKKYLVKENLPFLGQIRWKVAVYVHGNRGMMSITNKDWRFNADFELEMDGDDSVFISISSADGFWDSASFLNEPTQAVKGLVKKFQRLRWVLVPDGLLDEMRKAVEREIGRLMIQKKKGTGPTTVLFQFQPRTRSKNKWLRAALTAAFHSDGKSFWWEGPDWASKKYPLTTPVKELVEAYIGPAKRVREEDRHQRKELRGESV